MPWSPEKIPVYLRRTPEQQAADDALQARLKSAYGPGVRPNPTERHLMRARAVELSARAQLEHAQTDPHAKELHVTTARAQLAEARADQGYYLEAAEIHPDEQHCQRYRQIAEAIDRPDDDECGCQPERIQTVKEGKPVTVTIHAENVDAMVFDPRTRRLQGLHRCRCGAMNVKAIGPEHNRRIEASRRRPNG